MSTTVLTICLCVLSLLKSHHINLKGKPSSLIDYFITEDRLFGVCVSNTDVATFLNFKDTMPVGSEIGLESQRLLKITKKSNTISVF